MELQEAAAVVEELNMEILLLALVVQEAAVEVADISSLRQADKLILEAVAAVEDMLEQEKLDQAVDLELLY